MKNLFLFLSVLAVLMAGCGEDKKTSGTPAAVVEISNQRFFVIEGSVRNENGVFVADSATLASATVLPHEMNRFALSFTLQDGGSVTLLAHGKERLIGAASVKITRTGNQISAAEAQVPGAAPRSLLGAWTANLDVNGQLNLVVEIHRHNDETHIILEGEEAEFGAIPDQKTWGVKLEKASLISQSVKEGSES